MWDLIVVGGGISGLAAAYQAEQLSKRSGKAISCCLVESSSRLGGKVASEQRRGFLIEGGPDAFVLHDPETRKLLRQLGLAERLLPPREEQQGLYILSRGRLEPLPEGLRMLVPTRLWPFLRSPLLSWPGKLRMLSEPFVRPHAREEDSSVGEFVRHRCGAEALEALAEPLLAHIHVADIERMSLEATYPRLRAMEARYGSLRRGLAAAGRAAERPTLWTLREGTAELTAALAERLPRDSVFLGRRAVHLAEIDSEAEAGAPRYALELEGGTTLTAAAVILALPAFAAAELVVPWADELARRLGEIRYVSLATLSLGYRREDLEPPRGTGFFVPRSEAKTILAGTFSSNKYEGRAGPDEVLVRLFLGGPRSEELIELTDEELRLRVEAELAYFLAPKGDPVLSRLYRWPRGYPQYDVGHPGRVEALENEAPHGLLLAGSAFHGVGLPACIASGRKAAERAFALLGAASGSG